MKYQQEITVSINMSKNDLIKFLEDNNYKRVDTYILDDIYYVENKTDLKQSTLNILKKCILIRSIDNEKHFLTYKYKEYDSNENIINQGKSQVQVYNRNSAIDFLESIGYKELIHVTDNIDVYEKNGLELCIEDVNDKYLFIEVEENNRYNTIDKLINALELTGIDYNKGNYFVKKAKIIYEDENKMEKYMNVEDYIKINKKAYDIVAKEYKEKYRNNEGAKFFYDLIRDWIIESRKKDDEKVLEIGGGTGVLLSVLEENGYKTVDVELSTEMSMIAQETSPNTVIINDNILNVSFPPSSFDYILALAVLHNFPKKDLKELLIKIKKWLKDDGFFIIDTTANDVSEEGYYAKEDYKTKVTRYRKKFTKKELEELLIESGFSIEKCKDYVDASSGKNWLEYKLTKLHK